MTTPPVAGYPSGRTTSYTYTNGTTSAGGYDGAVPPAGLPYQETTPGGAVTTTLYYADGDVAQVTDPDGQRTVYAYDGLGRKTSQTVYSDTYPAGLVTTYTYDANGDLAHRDRPAGDRPGDRGGAHRADHHQLRPRRRRHLPDGDRGPDRRRRLPHRHQHLQPVRPARHPDRRGRRKTSYTYDAYGNKASETDPDGNVTDYAYDADGHLLTTTLENYTGSPPGSQAAAPLVEESRAYDPAGRLAYVTDAMGRITDYQYTDNGLLAGVQESSPDWSQSSYVRVITPTTAPAT